MNADQIKTIVDEWQKSHPKGSIVQIISPGSLQDLIERLAEQENQLLTTLVEGLREPQPTRWVVAQVGPDQDRREAQDKRRLELDELNAERYAHALKLAERDQTLREESMQDYKDHAGAAVRAGERQAEALEGILRQLTHARLG